MLISSYPLTSQALGPEGARHAIKIKDPKADLRGHTSLEERQATVLQLGFGPDLNRIKSASQEDMEQLWAPETDEHLDKAPVTYHSTNTTRYTAETRRREQEAAKKLDRRLTSLQKKSVRTYKVKPKEGFEAESEDSDKDYESDTPKQSTSASAGKSLCNLFSIHIH